MAIQWATTRSALCWETVKPQLQLHTGLSESQIREQLDRILTSETFARSERISAFLRNVVEEPIRGNSGTLKEQVIAHDVYRREEWIVRRRGSRLRPLNALGVPGGKPFDASWSPDSRRIVFELAGRDGNDDLYISDVAGGKPVT